MWPRQPRFDSWWGHCCQRPSEFNAPSERQRAQTPCATIAAVGKTSSGQARLADARRARRTSQPLGQQLLCAASWRAGRSQKQPLRPRPPVSAPTHRQRPHLWILSFRRRSLQRNPMRRLEPLLCPKKRGAVARRREETAASTRTQGDDARETKTTGGGDERRIVGSQDRRFPA